LKKGKVREINGTVDPGKKRYSKTVEAPFELEGETIGEARLL